MSKKFVILAVAFCVCLLMANIFETKVILVGGLTLTGGFIIFPISYIINDCICEVYGLRNTRFVVFTAFVMMLFFVLTSQLVRILPSPDYWDGDEHFDFIFNMNLRVSIASMAAFLAGAMSNALVMDRMKRSSGEKRFGIRAIASSLVGESLDSLVFFPIAFSGTELKHLLTIMITQVLLKTLYEAIILPITARVVVYLRRNP